MENIAPAAQPATSGVGITGFIRLVKHNPGGVKGSGPDGTVEFEDLFERGPDGRWAPKPSSYECMVQDMKVHNKVLKRGLGSMMHKLLSAHGGTYAPAEINSPTTNPFLAFILVADHTIQAKNGDERVEWAESDGPSNTVISSDQNTAREGRRGLLLSDTTNVYLKRVSISYPTTSPYREIEYVFYASGRTLSRAITGTPTDTITVGTKTFYCANGAFVSGDVGKILKVSGSSNGNNGDYTIATVPDSTHVTVTETIPGSDETSAYLLSSVPDGVYLSAVEAGDAHYIDWFPIKSVGLANGVAAGTGEASSFWGSRAVIGMGPTLQGISDRVYWHEGTGLHKYTTGEAIWEYDGGYIESGHLSTNDGSLCFDGDVTAEGVTGVIDQGGKWQSVTSSGPHKVGRVFSYRYRTIAPSGAGTDNLNASTGTVTLANGGFSTADVGRILKVRGATDPLNNKNYTIATYISGTQVTVTPLPNSTVTEDFMVPGATTYDGVYAPPKQFKGLRICMPRGVIQSYAPNLFKVQYLNPNANNGDPNPADDTHWSDFSGSQLNYLGSAQGVTIYNAGIYGVEYTITTPVATHGIRLTEMTAYDNTKQVEIAELYLFELMTAVGFSYGTDKLILKVKSGDNFRTYWLPTLTATQSVTTLAAYIDAVIRGWQMEALRSTFGFLWLRGTVGGDHSNLYLDTTANGSYSNAKLGFNTAGDTKTGITMAVTKKPTETLTLIYRVGLSGDLTTV